MKPVVAARTPRARTSSARVAVAGVAAVLMAGVFGLVTSAAKEQPAPTLSLIAGRNVNMVSGQELPNGDPYLQRQNEPSVAASTRNPLHLLAGANDYRTVDIPGNFDDGETGDAWLGVFKSFDGGERWQSTLLPGYPQDTSAEGLASPLKAYHAGADPVVRPGTNGLIYFAGLAFNRGEQAPSAIFVSRFVDNNNKENGDPIAYVSTSIVASSTGAEFLDKPWMAVDVPRQGAQVCKITTTKYAPVLLPGNNSKSDKSGQASPKAIGNISQQVRAGRMYVAWAALTTKMLPNGDADVSSRIMFSKSDDCGATWAKPVQISDPAHKVNQGATIAIDPRTGIVHVAWRQFGIDVNAPDAMMSSTSDASGKMAKPRKVHTFPTQRHEDQLLQKLQRAHRMGVVKELVSIKPYDSSTAGQRFRTNAYPTIAVDDESRVYLAWTERGYGGRPLGPGEVPSADGDARIVLSTSRAGAPWTIPAPVDNEAFAGHQLMPSMTYSGGRLMLVYYDLREDASETFAKFVDDSQIAGGKRHTLDVRAIQAPKGDQPVFGTSTRVSQYATRTLTLKDINGQFLKEQFQFNPPNLPLFQLGSVPFMGDYIDVAPAPAFVQDSAGGWIHNTASTTAPVFHAVWTDNRDVQQPKGALGWKDYTKPTTTPAAGGANCAPVGSGIRNQNVYSARLTMGLVAGSPGNTKPLSANVPRSFVVFAQNSTYSTKAFRFTIERQPTGGQASFSQLGLLEPEPLLLTVDVKVAPRSMVTRTVYATAANAKEQVPVSITEIGIVDFQPVTSGLTARVILNPDISNPDISNPDISNPDISNPDISNAEVYNPDISNPDISNPDISNPDISNPDISNPDISNIVIANPDISNPDISNPDISNPDISNPDISNPDISNAVLKDGSLTDVTWTLKNEGNTTASFNVNLFLKQATGDAAKAAGIKTQLVVHKSYKTPAADGCGVLRTQTQMVLVANVLNPEFKDFGEDTAFDPSNPDISNTTLWLEPGGEGKITLRIIDPDPTDAIDINPVEDVPTPVVQSDPVNTEDLSDPTPEPPATPAPTDPPPTPEPDMVELAYLLPFVPANTIVDQPMAPIVVRTIAGGLPRAGVQVTLAIATNPAGGRLGGVTTVLSDANGDATFTGLVIERAGVGYQLSASASAAGALPIISPPFAIKAIPVVTAAWAGSVVYDGLLHPATCTVTGLNGAVLSGAVITYTSGSAPVNVGAYGATCTFAGDALYEPASDAETLTITKAPTSTVTTGGTFEYDGAPHGSVCTVSSSSGAVLAGAVSYTPGGTSEPVSAGEYAVLCGFAGDANHDGSAGTNTITITARAATVTAGGGSKAYGGAEPVLSPVTTTFLAADAPGITLTQSRAAGETAGTYPVTAQATGGNVGNYAVTYVAGSFTITKAATTTSTTGGTFEYDGAPHGSVCTVTSASSAALNGTVTYNPGGTNEPVNAGEYAVLCEFAGDANHDASSGTNTITITARAATVTAGGGSKAYGGAEPVLSPVTTTFLAADAPGITLTQSRAAGETAGTYPVTAQATGGNVGNYAVTYAAGTFTITKASTTTTVTCPGGVAYTGTAHEVCSATVIGAGGLNQAVPVTYANNTDAGTATATAVYAGDANHDGSNDTETFAIAPAFPVATATGGTFAYDGQPHGGTCVVTGVNGEVLAGTSSYNPGGAPPVNPGTYTLTCSRPAGGNYMAASDDDPIVIQSPSLAGDWSGTYSWNCGPGQTGSASIALTINAPHFGGWLSNGTVTYLGGTGAASISRFSGAIGNPDQFGNLVRVTVPASAGNYAYNEFDGTLTNPGVLTITGTTLNGDTAVVPGSGCSAPVGRSGTFVITKTPSPFVVTTAADAGPGSLREVMTLANFTAAHDTIRFNIPGGGERVITVGSALPMIASEMALLGTTQPGYDGRPMVRVDGPGVGGYGFEVQRKSKISGLSVTRFLTQPAVFVTGGGSGSIIEFSYIGTDRTGAAGLGNHSGVVLHYTTGAVVRDSLLSSNNFSGVGVTGGSSNQIRGNKIGTGLDGLGVLSNLDNGITLYDGSSGTVIDGNVISGNGVVGGGNGNGIDIQQSGALAPVSGTIITNNIIGLDAAGNLLDRGGQRYFHLGTSADLGPAGRGNAGFGIRVNQGTATAIGLAGAGNTISGNTRSGVYITGVAATPASVMGNKIGTNPTGTAGAGNGGRGIEVVGSAAEIGRAGAANINLISGNILDGVFANGNTSIINNRIGVNASVSAIISNGAGFLPGTVDPGCCHTGIFVDAPGNIVSGNTVGGTTGHDQFPGIRSGGAAGQAPNLIQDNFVGTDPTQSLALGNGVGIGLYGDKSGTRVRRNIVANSTTVGIWLVEGTEDAMIGGPVATDGNTVRNNGAGIVVGYNPGASDVRNSMLSNLIYSNTGLGIDLGNNGVTVDDVGDTDTGPNGLQNFGTLSNVDVSGATTKVDLFVDTNAPNVNYDIQIFASAACDANGYGEGQRLVGTFTSSSNGAADISASLTLSEAVPAGQFLTATVQRSATGGTSEFSQCVTVPAARPAFTAWSSAGSGTVTTTDNGLADGTPQMTYAHNGVGNFSGQWEFATVSGETRTVQLAYTWNGIHSWFQATTRLEVFIRRGGSDIVVATPVNGGTFGDFRYTGNIAVAVQAGDTYGFKLYGSHFDSSYILQGSLDVTVGGAPPAPLPAPGEVTPGPAAAPQPSRPESMRQ